MARSGAGKCVRVALAAAPVGWDHRLVVNDRKRREVAYRDSVATVLAYIDDEDADLYNFLDEAAKVDALGAAYRLTFLAAKAVEELAAATGEAPSEILNRLIQETHR